MLSIHCWRCELFLVIGSYNNYMMYVQMFKEIVTQLHCIFIKILLEVVTLKHLSVIGFITTIIAHYRSSIKQFLMWFQKRNPAVKQRLFLTFFKTGKVVHLLKVKVICHH